MKTMSSIITTLITFSILLAACSMSANSTTTTITGTNTPVIQPTEIPDEASVGTEKPTVIPLTKLTLNVGQDANIGSFLIDDQGRTLYLHTTDSINVSICIGECAKEWTPVLIADGLTVVAGSGVDATKLGKTTHAEGGVQVTYNGWPLYYYNKDSHPGNVSGQGQNDFFVISPAGDKVE